LSRLTLAVFAITLAAALSVSATPARAATIAGGGYSAVYSGESSFTSLPAGARGQFSAIFFNDGQQTWLPGVVGLLVCLPDKLTCNVPSPNAAYASGWYSSSAYATVTSPVIPGANGFFIYSFVVPASAAPGSSATFFGDVGLIPTGALFRPSGYFQTNTAPAASTLAITPASASVPVGSTFQFIASSASTWSVIGGCGAVTTTGLFAATAMSAPSQPCKVVAVAGASSASAPVSVFGPPASLSCTVSAPTVVADGASTVVVTASMRDINGSFVSTGTSPDITFRNITPELSAMTPLGVQAPTAGSASVTLTATTVAGVLQVTATATGLVGCAAILTSVTPGPPVRTIATFLTNPIAADGTSRSVLRVDTVDSAGVRALSDGLTTISLNRATASAAVCSVDGPLSGQVTNGRIEFPVRSSTAPGLCEFGIAPNNDSIRGTSVSMTTRIVGPAARLTVSASDSPQTISTDGLLTVVVDIVDAAGQRVTSSSAVVVLQLDPTTCAGAPGGDIAMVSGSSPSAAQGRATYTLRSTGAYPACALTFTSSGLAQVVTAITFKPGIADHLSCSIVPSAILKDGLGSATLTVNLRDASNNIVTAGGPYSISVSRSAGTATSLLTASPQLTVNGVATFLLRSGTNVGIDSYGASISSGSQPSMRTPVTLQACTISVQATIP
jgi:hypothetical protein